MLLLVKVLSWTLFCKHAKKQQKCRLSKALLCIRFCPVYTYWLQPDVIISFEARKKIAQILISKCLINQKYKFYIDL